MLLLLNFHFVTNILVSRPELLLLHRTTVYALHFIMMGARSEKEQSKYSPGPHGCEKRKK